MGIFKNMGGNILCGLFLEGKSPGGQINQKSRQFIAKPINCEKTSRFLTKEKYFFYYKIDFYLNEFYFNGFTLYFSFWISAVNCSRKIDTVAWSQVFYL